METNFGKFLLQIIPCAYSFTVNKNQISINVPNNRIIEVLTILKYNTNTQFKILADLCVIDYPLRKNRFTLVYNLLSLKFNSRIQVKVILNEFQTIPTITSVYTCANWWEREAWDLFGVYFTNHPDLRRILTDYGFEGHPLRKDYPLTGYLEVRYNEQDKRVTYETVSLPQESRSFDFDNPWK